MLGRLLSSMRCDKEVLLLLKSNYTTLMKAFALSGQPKLANKFFDEVLNDPWVKVDLVSWNMSGEVPSPLKPDERLLDTLADICARAASLGKLWRLLLALKSTDYPQIRPSQENTCGNAFKDVYKYARLKS
ncbi:unnamed protein product [Fraxinus pennsylvanica]|uniref:Uncharacterized protein n=1 Tax=Fraxinus pennsylvanica TaxID=56036 RepID=A0AAD2A2B3_9LAMI|nr:unnamed protein product [Fraxinus pennsylvanica]